MSLEEKQNSLFQNLEPFRRSRGYLPHTEAVEKPQMITYRLHDSLPSQVLAQYEDELKHLKSGQRERERRQLIEEYLDQGAGSCVLNNEAIAQTVQQNLLHFDGIRYKLHAWVIMPNHVHVLVTPVEVVLLSNIIHSWKSYTAKKANEILGCRAEFWQREYFDRSIRNQSHFCDVVSYIHNNPVKSGLCKSPSDWLFSSASKVFGSGF